MARKRAATKAGRRGAGAPSDPAGGRDLIDMEEAIRILKTSRPTFYRWLRGGRVKGMKLGRQWRFYRDDIERFLEGEAPRLELPVSPDPLLQTLRKKIREAGGREPSYAPTVSPAEEAVRLMVLLGVTLGATDVHITSHVEPGGGEGMTALRYTVHGTLGQHVKIDRRLGPAIAAEWKRMASCNVEERRKPQDGSLTVTLSDLGVKGGDEGKEIEMRIHFTPASMGEMVTVRILDPGEVELDLDRVGFASREMERLLRAIRSPSGVVIVTGPTGAGKTTTIYSCLNRLAGPEAKVVTVEDPVEFNLPWVTQVPVDEGAGVTYPSAARALLRSVPNVLYVAEIRDAETAWIVHQAALTGRLAFTTLHAETAAQALVRMVEVGVNPFVVADSTRLAVAQRLVRKLCPHCSVEEKPAADEIGRAAEAARKGGLDWDSLERNFRKPVGCRKCHRTGYVGRTAIAEALEVTPAVGAALRSGATPDEIRAIVVGEGMTTLVADGIRRAAAGETTLDDVISI